MTLFAMYWSDKQPVPQAVPDRFSWNAAVLPPVFLLAHRLWLETLAWLAGAFALRAVSPLIGGGAAFWLYVLVAMALSFAAPTLRRRALHRRGWQARGYRVAASADLARLEFMK